MLELIKVTKNYVTGDTVTEALKGLDVKFRKNEFVSILGPSGCGKTTLLNIIGGLDRYTSGDLVIKGKSTKDFNDRDWDTYRNHSIGFVFQSYNLISHLSILGNVELALSIGGLTKKERQGMAQKALERVGLGNITKKKPNQLSGGQMQRVAIARALVSDPEIILADEPTGALDSETSVQIMDLLKEVANDRLVIMVTHNPELAKQYSNRIITMKDGNLIDDSNPFDGKDENNAVKEDTGKKAKMKLTTAFTLSGKNLLSKAKRTALVCVAGSIGIIGVSAVLAVSTGVKSYVNGMQDDMLSGNPITITKTSLDLSAMMEASSSLARVEALSESHRDGYVDVDYFIKYLAEQKDNISSYAVKNEITKEYVAYVDAMPKDYYGAIAKEYGLNTKLNIFTNVDFTLPVEHKEEIENIDVVSLQYLIDAYTAIVKTTSFGQFADMIKLFTNSISVAPSSKEYIESQYDVLAGTIAENDNEMMLVVSKDTKLRDIFLGQIGYYSQDEFVDVINKYASGSEVELPKKDFSYDELLGNTGKKFYYYKNDNNFIENHAFDGIDFDAYKPYIVAAIKMADPTITDEKAAEQADQMVTSLKGYKKSTPYYYQGHHNKNDGVERQEIKITGILQPKQNVQYGCLSTGFVMSTAFQDKLLSDGLNSVINNKLKELKAAYTADKTSFSGFMTPLQYKYAFKDPEHPENPAKLVKVELPQLSTGTTPEVIFANIGKLSTFLTNAPGSAVSVVDISSAGGISSNSVVQALFGDAYSVESQFETAQRSVGGETIPSKISIYPRSFEKKYLVTDYLDEWNGDKILTFKDQSGNTIVVYPKGTSATGGIVRQDIKYTDNLELIIRLINNMIEIVTIALVCFTSLSLVVSTVMIGIITYVSVVERVKEIGIIRSLGGRKLDVSNLFNVETFIIGSISGVFGILVTYGISAIINIIINTFAKVGTLVVLPWNYALIIIAVSIALTLISGLIPARAAAHKDPVVALRTSD